MKRFFLGVLLLMGVILYAAESRYLYPLATVKNSQAYDISVDSGYVFVRNQRQIWIYNSFNAWQPRLEASFFSVHPIEDINLQGASTLYIASHEPTNTITPVDSLNTFGRIYFVNNIIGDKLAREGSTLYVADRIRGIDIFNIAKGAMNDLIASFSEKWGIRDFLAEYPYLYALNDFGAVIVDVSEQDFPLSAATNYMISNAEKLVKDREYLFVAAGKELLVLSVRDIKKPSLVAQMRMPGEIQDLAIKDQRLYLALGQGGVRIIDISVPTRMQDLNQFYPPFAVYSVALENDFIYLGLGREGWMIYEYR